MRPVFRSFAVLTISVLGAATAWGQATMPANWQQLPPDQFLATAEPVLAADPTAEHEREIVQHAWQAFLNNEGLVTSGDWETVERLMDTFVGRRGARVTGNTFAERETAQQQVETDLATLRTRVAARVDGNPQLVTASSFAELWSLDDTLAASGVAKAERAEHFAAWTNTNDWQALSLAEQGTLLGALDADRIDRWRMSVRWTGFVTAPTTGDYTFSQLAHYREDGVFKVWIDGQAILDSTPTEGATPEQARQRFRGKPVALTAGAATPIRIEFSHNVPREAMTDDTAYPMAVLLWESANIAEQIVPASAYSPPEGVTGTSGLWGEYFNGPTLDQANLVTAQLDGPVDFIWPGLDDFWSWRQVAAVHDNEWDAVFEACVAKLADPQYLASLSGDELQDMLLAGGRHVLGAARASERIRILDGLLANPQKLAAIDTHVMGRLVKHTYMLPGDRHVRLIGTWAEQRAQPRTELGSMFGWEEGTYEWNNLQFYWHIGHFLAGEHSGAEDVEQLWADYLVRANGECNLAVAYATAWAAQENEQAHVYRQLIADRLADETLTGDQRMTWLLAKTYGEEVMVGGRSQPGQAMQWLQEAMLVAQTPDYKFWSLQELVARLGSTGNDAEAKAAIERYGSNVSTPEQQVALQGWHATIDRLARTYQQLQEDLALQQKQEQQAAYVNVLQERLALAEEAGDSGAAAHYRELISQVKAWRVFEEETPSGSGP